MRATTERARQQFAAGAISASAYLEAQRLQRSQLK
jgi:hypothetical protein